MILVDAIKAWGKTRCWCGLTLAELRVTHAHQRDRVEGASNRGTLKDWRDDHGSGFGPIPPMRGLRNMYERKP